MSNADECRRYRQRLRLRAEQIHGSVCKLCGFMFDLEYAHVVGTELYGDGRGMTRRYLDIIHNARCYIRLCKECHIAYDRSRQNAEVSTPDDW